MAVCAALAAPLVLLAQGFYVTVLAGEPQPSSFEDVLFVLAILGYAFFLSLAGALFIGIPFYVVMKLFRLNSPVVIALSGGPLMWCLTRLDPDLSLNRLFIACAAAVSLVFGVLLAVQNRNKER